MRIFQSLQFPQNQGQTSGYDRLALNEGKEFIVRIKIFMTTILMSVPMEFINVLSAQLPLRIFF